MEPGAGVHWMKLLPLGSVGSWYSTTTSQRASAGPETKLKVTSRSPERIPEGVIAPVKCAGIAEMVKLAGLTTA